MSQLCELVLYLTKQTFRFYGLSRVTWWGYGSRICFQFLTHKLPCMNVKSHYHCSG